MSAVEQVLPEIRERIQSYQGKSISEMGTKTNLINPMLESLGWDLGDLEQVHFEYRYRPAHNPVDYALMERRAPRLFVEAKALGTNLDDHRWADQIMGYTGVAGVGWVVLTDGNEYRIYNTHASVPVEQKLFRTIRLTDADDTWVTSSLDLISRAALRKNRLEAHWQQHFVDRQVESALKGLFAQEPDRSLVNVLQRRTKNLTRRDVADSLERVRAEFAFPLVPDSDPDPLPPPPPPPSPSGNELKLLIAARLVETPHELHTTYKRQRITAHVIADGGVVYREQKFSSLSSAAAAARRFVSGTPDARFPTNGWTFWKFTDSDGQIKLIDELRQQLRARRGSNES